MRVLLLVLWASTVLAETHVLSVGVESYDDARISTLKYAVADAQAVASAFRAAGTTPRNVRLLTSAATAPDERPTRINVLKALQDVRERAEDDDLIVFFFAGHGVESDGAPLLLTVDTRRDLIADTGLPMRLVDAALAGTQAAGVLFLVDACRNAIETGREDADAILSDGLARGLRPSLLPPPGVTRSAVVALLLSCDVGQRSWEYPQAGHGVFTHYVLRGLAGAAAGDDGPVSLQGLASYVQTEVGRWSERSGKAQTPRLIEPDGRDLVILVPPPEAVVSVSLANQPLAAVVKLLADQYGAEIVLGAGVDPGLRVTGRLDNQPLSVVLKVLLHAFGIQVRREDSVYVLEAPGAPAAGLLGALPAHPGRTLVVSADGQQPYRTISDAVRDAASGDRIAVLPGHYTENVVLDMNLVVLGVGGREQIVITGSDGPAAHVKAQVTLQGLTLRQEGDNAKIDLQHGVVLVDDRAAVTIIDCDLSTRVTRTLAAVVFKVACRGTLRETSIHDCHNGLMAQGGSAVTIADCEFRDLTVSGLYACLGARISARQTTITRAGSHGVFSHNTAWDDRPPRTKVTPSIVVLEGCDLVDCRTGMSAIRGSTVTAKGCRISGSTTYAVRAGRDGLVQLTGCDLRENFPSPFRIEDDGRLEASDNQTDGRWQQIAAAPVSAPTDRPPAGWPAHLAWPPVADNRWRYRVHPTDQMPQVLLPETQASLGLTQHDLDRLRELIVKEWGEASTNLYLGQPDRRPANVGPVWVDLHEVTSGQYCGFLNAVEPDPATRRTWVQVIEDDVPPSVLGVPVISGAGQRFVATPGNERFPANYVTFLGAQAYARWVGRELPSTTLEEFLLRAGEVGQGFPWGWSVRPPAGFGNLADEAFGRQRGTRSIFAGYDDGYALAAPVATFAPNAFGVFDLFGNVWEWCGSPWTSGDKALARFQGGSYASMASLLRADRSFAGALTDAAADIGFRCCCPAL